MADSDSSNNPDFKKTIFKILMNKYKRQILYELFENPKHKVMDIDELLKSLNNDISFLFPTIEEMVNDGLVVREMRKVSKAGISEGMKATYTLEDRFYKACFEFNKDNGKILEKD